MLTCSVAIVGAISVAAIDDEWERERDNWETIERELTIKKGRTEREREREGTEFFLKKRNCQNQTQLFLKTEKKHKGIFI